MNRYVDRRGGLSVEKTDKVEKQKVVDTVSTFSATAPVTITGDEAFETMLSYQTGNFAKTDSSEKGVCKICGAKTAYKNRQICVDCWKKYNQEIVDGLKTAVKDVEIKID